VSNHSRFASDQIAELLAVNGVRELEDAFRVGDLLGEQHFQRATRHLNKHVVKLELAAPAGPTTVYIKRQWRRERWLPRPTDIRHRINLQCSPVHEWRGLRVLQQAGFDVSEPLALFWSGWGLARGAVVTRAVPPQLSMVDRLLSGEMLEMSRDRRHALIDAAVNVVVRLRDARISWRSMKAKHFYPEELGDGRWRIWLIDCEGVSQWSSRRDCEREWQTYLKSFTKHAPELQKDFLSAYARASGLEQSSKKAA
jgi:hypothetical protein